MNIIKHKVLKKINFILSVSKQNGVCYINIDQAIKVYTVSCRTSKQIIKQIYYEQTLRVNEL